MCRELRRKWCDDSGSTKKLDKTNWQDHIFHQKCYVWSCRNLQKKLPRKTNQVLCKPNNNRLRPIQYKLHRLPLVQDRLRSTCDGSQGNNEGLSLSYETLKKLHKGVYRAVYSQGDVVVIFLLLTFWYHGHNFAPWNPVAMMLGQNLTFRFLEAF